MACKIYISICKKIKYLSYLLNISPNEAIRKEYDDVKNEFDLESISYINGNEEEFMKNMGSFNFYGRINEIFLNLQHYSLKENVFLETPLLKKVKYSKYTPKQLFTVLCNKFLHVKISMPKQEVNNDICCDKKMVNYPDSSKICCDECGYERKIIGCYEEEYMSRSNSRSRDYSTSDFCEKWLSLLQGKDIVNIKREDYKKLLDYMRIRCTRNGKIWVLLVKKITCKEVRNWLKRNKKTSYNRCIPLLRRRVSKDLGFELVPPQYTYSEEKRILEDWAKIGPVYSENYNRLKGKKNKKNNNSSYTICILFIVNSIWPNDPRSKDLKNYVHIQSSDTMKIRINAWKATCKQIGYRYVPI